jgi:hypothetical protein
MLYQSISELAGDRRTVNGATTRSSQATGRTHHHRRCRRVLLLLEKISLLQVLVVLVTGGQSICDPVAEILRFGSTHAYAELQKALLLFLRR